MIRVTTPIGKDTFIATAFHGEEHISKPFRFQASLLSDNHDISQSDIVGKTFTASIHHAGKTRQINGFVTNFSMLDVNAEGMRKYEAIIQPGLWFCNLSGTNRVFEDKTATEIIKEVLSEYSRVVQFSDKSTRSVISREYCVQFGETDFQFIDRLLSEEGISYYFKHTENSHELVFCDSPKGFYKCTNEEIEYDGGGSLPTKNSVSSWRRDFNYHGGGFEFKDYNEYTVGKDNKQVVKTKNDINNASDYIQNIYGLNHFLSKGDSQHAFKDDYHKSLAECAIEAQECRFDIAHGSSDCPEFSAGGQFSFAHTLKSEKGDYLLTSVRIAATDSNSDETSFSNSFRCIPDKVVPRPDPFLGTRRDISPQIAEVVEVCATLSDSSKDKFTQVKVKFPWNSEQNSCWVRVMQSFAGKNWGANFVPRVGQEVIITYINGDPDRPVVTGAVYNGYNLGPNFNASQSGWKTQLDGSKFNELKFDDKKDAEEIYMEAGKDHNFVVHNDQTGKIENNQSIEVKQNRDILITDGNESTNISKGNHSLMIKSGTQTTDAKGAITITSKTSIELKVAGNSIKITNSGITIKGTMLSCKGDSMAEMKAGGILTLKGGLTKIN
ncbi:type VI secretion system Vgr family protein [Microbulbifer aggregans]|uniref:type VI secretion system Vgr family protein n=1 Tax=Microbulbifer aggregans TaxID=1769779 RepID=UPI001CFE6998|nr:type VI secretion system tip protein TssI/VgrG [Microbulbifer aggregans]